jgi:hypothetical protein
MKLTATDLFPGSGHSTIELTHEANPDDPAWMEAWIEQGKGLRDHFRKIHTAHKIAAMIAAGTPTVLDVPFTPGRLPFDAGSGTFWISPALNTVWHRNPTVRAEHWKRTRVTNRIYPETLAIFEPDDTTRPPMVFKW